MQGQAKTTERERESHAAPQQRDLTQGPVAKTLLLFALPSLGVNILQSANGSINAIWVGRFLGEDALAATANANMIMFLLYSALFGFAMSSTIIIGQAMGRRDVAKVRQTVAAAVALFVVAGLVTAVAGWIATPAILRVMATPDNAQKLALIYLRVMFLSVPFSFVMILLSSALRGVGDSVTPLRITMLSVALDVVLNPLLILGWGPIPALGIAGAAWASTIAGLVSLAVLVLRVYAKDLTIRLRGSELRWLRPNVQQLKPVLAMGLPIGLSMLIMSFSSLVMVGLINREGVATTAAFGVMNQLWSYVQMPAVAVGSAVSAMAAQNIGAGLWPRVGRVAWAGIGVNLAMTSTLLGLLTFFAEPLARLFLPGGSEAIAIAVHINYAIGWTFLLMGVSMVVTSVVRANGAVMVPLIILIFSAIIMRFVVGFTLHESWGADAIWWAFGVSSIVSLSLSMAYFLGGSWRKPRPAIAGGSRRFS